VHRGISEVGWTAVVSNMSNAHEVIFRQQVGMFL
jgi:hypothetical protein